MKYNTTRRNNNLHNGNITRRMNADITGGGFGDSLKRTATSATDSLKRTATSATDSLKRTATKIKDLVPNIQDLGVLTSFFKMFIQIVPDNVWKLTAESTLNKICETVRDADTAVPGDPENSGCTIKIEIIKQVNKLIEKLIVGINMQKMQQRIMEKLMEKMKDPLDEIMNQECIALKIMDSLLSKPDLKNFLFVYFTSDYVMESQASQGSQDKRLLDFINNEDIDNYFKYLSEQKGTVINEQSQNEEVYDEKDGEGELGKDVEVVSDRKDVDVEGEYGKGKQISVETNDPEISKLNERINALMSGGTGTNVEEVAEAAKEVIKSFNSLMQTIITTIMAEAVADAKSENEDSDKKIFLKASDMSNRILNAASFHLEKPEGRQMYLRQFEKLLSRSINTFSDFDALMIPLFKQCLKNEGFINLLDSYIRNDFMNRLTEDNILVKNDPFELTEENITDVKKSIELFLDGFKEKVKTHLEKINPVETIYNDIEGSKCKTYGSIPEETITHKRELDEEPEQTNATADSIAETDNNESDFKKGTYAILPGDQAGGNIRKSRNKKYSPKKQKQTRRKR